MHENWISAYKTLASNSQTSVITSFVHIMLTTGLSAPKWTTGGGYDRDEKLRCIEAEHKKLKNKRPGTFSKFPYLR